MAYQKEFFGTLSNGTEIFKHNLSNDKLSFSISELGACITHLIYEGVDVVSGFNKADAYEGSVGSMGFTIGRHANRIADASFTLNGKTFTLAKNNGENHLHGGLDGKISKKIFHITHELIQGQDALICDTFSPDGEEGYPGNLNLRVVFTLVEPSTLKIEYFAKSDKDTILNLTNHSYFNLNGHADGTIKDHSLQIDADFVTKVREGLIPTGELSAVENTHFDFRNEKQLKVVLDNIHADEQIAMAGGLDHNFVLNNNGKLAKIATLKGNKSGIIMHTYTSEPGVQIYSACTTDIAGGKDGAHYGKFSLLCLETQHFPDSIHHPRFPSIILQAEDEFYSITKYEFTKA